MGISDENTFYQFLLSVAENVKTPVVWFREKVVEPNREDYNWYHRKFRRVPTIDECYTDDVVCFQEADEQFRRDKMVDDEIIAILKRRQEECYQYEGHDRRRKCAHLLKDYDDACTNWFSKYGDLGMYRNVRTAYLKQKHRMVWERRHGPIGSGYKDEPEPILK